jgi:pimeloyl-ACP methyl ester carboxylesterase
MPFAAVNDTKLHYIVLPCDKGGDAEYVVMIHGLAASMAFWYFQLAPQIARNYNVILYDLKGHGRSVVSAHGYRPVNMADEL